MSLPEARVVLRNHLYLTFSVLGVLALSVWEATGCRPRFLWERLHRWSDTGTDQVAGFRVCKRLARYEVDLPSGYLFSRTA